MHRRYPNKYYHPSQKWIVGVMTVKKYSAILRDLAQKFHYQVVLFHTSDNCELSYHYVEMQFLGSTAQPIGSAENDEDKKKWTLKEAKTEKRTPPRKIKTKPKTKNKKEKKKMRRRKCEKEK